MQFICKYSIVHIDFNHYRYNSLVIIRSLLTVYSHNIDPFGDHHLSCRGQYDKITRHDALRDVILSPARLAALSPQLEAPLLLANSLARPADIFLPSWCRGSPAAHHCHLSNATTDLISVCNYTMYTRSCIEGCI